MTGSESSASSSPIRKSNSPPERKRWWSRHQNPSPPSFRRRNRSHTRCRNRSRSRERTRTRSRDRNRTRPRDRNRSRSISRNRRRWRSRDRSNSRLKDQRRSHSRVRNGSVSRNRKISKSRDQTPSAVRGREDEPRHKKDASNKESRATYPPKNKVAGLPAPLTAKSTDPQHAFFNELNEFSWAIRSFVRELGRYQAYLGIHPVNNVIFVPSHGRTVYQNIGILLYESERQRAAFVHFCFVMQHYLKSEFEIHMNPRKIKLLDPILVQTVFNQEGSNEFKTHLAMKQWFDRQSVVYIMHQAVNTPTSDKFVPKINILTDRIHFARLIMMSLHERLVRYWSPKGYVPLAY